jgi:RNA polymerase sigma factor (sigma-70 family)
MMEALKSIEYKSSQMDDAEVVKRVVAGEKALFEILMRRYNQTVFRIVRSYLRNDIEVQDIMQNTYLKAFDKLYQFQGLSSFSTWLIRIAINEALLRIKDIKKDNVIFLHPDRQSHEILPINQIPDQQMNPEKAIIRQEAGQLLEQAIDNLPEKYRIIYMLKEVEGLDNAAVGQSLGISESNIKVRLHRAKKLLKENLFELTSKGEVFEFGNARCDALVTAVMGRIG